MKTSKFSEHQIITALKENKPRCRAIASRGQLKK